MNLRSKVLFISALMVLLATAIAFAGDAKKGEELYQNNCAVCHGDKGQGRGGPMGWFTGGGGEVSGLIGNQLSNQAFLSMATDDYIRQSIVEGRPDRPMPSWKGTLKDSEVNDIIAFIRTWQTAAPLKISYEPVWGDPAAGKELFNSLCYECHGVNGKGTDLGPALNNQGFLNVATDDFIKQTVMRGRAGTIMRPFIKGDPDANVDLDESQINDVVAYIRTWDKKAKDKIEPWLLKTGK